MQWRPQVVIFVLCSFRLVSLERGDGVSLDTDGYHRAPRAKRSSQANGRDDQTDWVANAQEALREAVRNQPIVGRAKNVILFVGDGLGPTTVTAARKYLSDVLEKKRVDTKLSWEEFPNVALSKTDNVDVAVPDSAATATAILCGEKNNFYTLGVNQKVAMGDCGAVLGNELKSIFQHSQEAGKWTGIVTNTRITHATPAAAYAHSAHRDWEASVPELSQGQVNRCKDIALQLIEDNPHIRVLMGGGRSTLLPNTEVDVASGQDGKRLDGRNLIQEWVSTKMAEGLNEDEYKFTSSQAELVNVDVDKIQYLLGLFSHDHMEYEYQRMIREPQKEPSLTEMVEKAIQILSKNDDGYFLLVEGGRIDHAHHDNIAFRALNETVAFSQAVEKAMAMTDERDTMLVVTADHSHVFTYGGYPSNDVPIWGVNDYEQGQDGKPFLLLSYANGPGFHFHRTRGSIQNETPRKHIATENTGAPNYQFDASVPLESETHGGEDVAIYARGPMAHLFHGVKEQHYIAHVMSYASCVGDNKDNCNFMGIPPDGASDTRGGAVLVILLSILALLVN